MADTARFDPQPTLAGARLSLRPLRPEDFEALYAAASDPLIWEQHPQHDRWQRPVFEQFFQSALDSHGALVAVDAASGALVGSSRYYEIDAARRELAIGYTFLVRSHWGGPANAEMKRLMLEHAFGWARRVWFHVGAANLRSRRAMEKIGARLSHMGQHHFGGSATDYAFYCIDAADWPAPLVLRELTGPDEALVGPLGALLVDAVDGGASVGFLAPLPPERAARYWRETLAALGPGLRLWVAERAGQVLGSVQLAPCLKDNGRHRGELQKLFVLGTARGRGVARRLLAAAEQAARAQGLTLLVLDTLEGSAAEHLYRAAGWERAGAVPRYALTPDGEPWATVYYYKLLD